jgi:hypothetical protein
MNHETVPGLPPLIVLCLSALRRSGACYLRIGLGGVPAPSAASSRVSGMPERFGVHLNGGSGFGEVQ